MDTAAVSLPLKIVWPWVFVLAQRTKRTDVARAIMDKPMSNHLILALEAFASLTPRTAPDWAVVRSVGAMYVGVRAVS